MPNEKEQASTENTEKSQIDIPSIASIVVPEAVKQVEELKALIELNAKAAIAATFMHFNPHKNETEFDPEGFEKAWAYLSNGYPVLDFSDEPETQINGHTIPEQEQ